MALDYAELPCELTVIDGGAEALACSRAFDHVPAAILTSSASPHDRARTEAFGIAQYISKPPD